MNSLSPPDPSVAPVRYRVNLVSEGAVSSRLSVARLLSDFEIRHVSPAAILEGEVCERERIMVSSIATLVDWTEETPVILSMLKGVARRMGVPLVVLCGPNQAEQVAALVVGGDDVLLHPVNPIMLQARLLVYQRRREAKIAPPETMAGDGAGDGLPGDARAEMDLPIPAAHDVCRVGPLVLDRTAQKFYVAGHRETLSPKAFDLLELLMRDVGKCHARDNILNEVWGLTFDTETNILDAQIYKLRCRLKAYGLDSMIETVRGVGYRLEVPEQIGLKRMQPGR